MPEPEFDELHFEQLMSDAAVYHNNRQYDDALLLSTQAFDLAPDNSSEKGRAACDNSARCDRLDRIEEARTWAERAYEIHDNLVNAVSPPTREALRERSASALYLGVSGLRQVIQARRDGRKLNSYTVLRHMRQSWSDIQIAKLLAPENNDRKIDQYEINAARRVSMAESLIGSRSLGRSISARAVKIAFLSESPKLDSSNHNLSNKQRRQAKVKAIMGGVAAVGVGIFATHKDNLRRKIAWQFADKAL